MKELVIVVLLVLAALSGCIGVASQPAAPTPMPIYVTVYVTPTPEPEPAFKILTDEGTCSEYTDSLYIEGTVKNNGNYPHTLVLKGDSYDKGGVKLGTGTDYVSVDGHGISKFKIIVLDGCSEGEGTYKVRVDSFI